MKIVLSNWTHKQISRQIKCVIKHFKNSINLDDINKTLLWLFISVEMLWHFTSYNPGFVIRNTY